MTTPTINRSMTKKAIYECVGLVRDDARRIGAAVQDENIPLAKAEAKRLIDSTTLLVAAVRSRYPEEGS